MRYLKLTPYECLTEKDKELIELYINWFGPSNPSNMDWSLWAGTEKVLTHWNLAKNEALFKMFGEELILRRPYTYKYNISGLSREIAVAMEAPAFKDFSNWWSWKVKHNANAKFEIISDYEQVGLYYSKFYNIESAFSADYLANNSYDGKDFKVKFEDGSIFKVTTGMKPMKILHKFIEKYGEPEDEEMFEHFRIWHSQLLNQKAVDGELCLSIHPLDFMTMSDNANKWSSCMRWTDKYGNPGDPGDYRAGTVDCMNSPYIVIAYLHNPKHPFTLDNFNEEWSWNSKRWRELFIVNEGSITEVKGYPYQDENLTNACLMWLKELANKNLGWIYEDEEVDMNKPIDMGDGKIMYIDYLKSAYMYKDIGGLKQHVGRMNKKVLIDKFQRTYMYSRGDNNSIFIDIPYGGEPSCMCCGKIRDEYDKGDKSVMCPRCDSITTCCCCGDPIYCDDDCYWVEDNDEPMCYNCWSEETSIDDLSEETHMTSNMEEIWLLLGYDKNEEPIWYHGKSLFIYEPYNNWYYQKLFNHMPEVYRSSYYGSRHYVTLDMIIEGKYHQVMNAFENPDEDDLYPEDLYYMPDKSLAYPEDEE